MQRRTFFKALFGGAGAAMLSHRADTQDRTILLQESRIAGFQYYRGDAIWPILSAGKSCRWYANRSTNMIARLLPYILAMTSWVLFRKRRTAALPRCSIAVSAWRRQSAEC